ncbi:ESPR domain-containing protein [Erwinia aphidicola]|uniref:ESPR domain-containing protein n=1 Tax=Erwinia aphidicola TaxID=68334 RepID=UPI003BAFC473
MNKHCYRLIFSRTHGELRVVSELARSCSSEPGQHRGGEPFMGDPAACGMAAGAGNVCRAGDGQRHCGRRQRRARPAAGGDRHPERPAAGQYHRP